MRYLSLASGKKISKIGLGTDQFGSSEWGYGRHYDEKEAHAIVRRAMDLGVNHFDSAEIYGSGRSERILGQAIANMGESVFLATKLWPVFPAARMVRKRALASARRLGVTHLDLYQVHWPHPLIGDRAIMSGMRSLQVEGTVGEVGVSMYSLRRWRAAEDALGGKILSNQVAYSLVARSPELDLLPFAEDNDRVIIAHSPLHQGLLSGRYHGIDRSLNRVRATDPAFRSENLELTKDLLDVVREVADAHGATPAQIALSWVIRPGVVVAIPGASSVRQLEENAAAAEIELADDEYLALSKASEQFCLLAPGVSARRNLRRQLSALRHTAWGTRQVAQTVRYDRSYARHPHRAPKDGSRPPSASAQP